MDYALLSKSMLFHKLDEEQIKSAIKQLKAKEYNLKKGEVILRAGEKADKFGIILKGSLIAEHINIDGARIILSVISENNIFADLFAILRADEYPINFVANEDTTVLLFHLTNELKALNTDTINRVVKNMLYITEKKVAAYAGKSVFTSQKRMRDKINMYFSYLSHQAHSKKFTIPLNRQGLADYLAVDRSALSYELSRMQKEGLIKYKKNEFELLY